QDYSLAARLFDDCDEHGSRGNSDMINHGMALFLNGRCAEALSVFQRLESSHVSRSTVLNNIGMALSALGRWQEAVQYCRRALAVDQVYRFAWDSLGFAYLKGEKYEEAIPPLLKAVELEPNYPDAWRHLLHAYDRAGMTEKLAGARAWVMGILPEEVERFERERGNCLPN
ncbi:MAG TPA: tetratricopeptide repeat protein, partial [Kiritimatiellia bacterium]|nr:tetratricopeptide repeat protein [Kiritimatiellia bacterium]